MTLTLSQIEFWSKKMLVPAGWPVRNITHTDDGIKITIGGLHSSGASYPTMTKTATMAEIADYRAAHVAPRSTYDVQRYMDGVDGSGTLVMSGLTYDRARSLKRRLERRNPFESTGRYYIIYRVDAGGETHSLRESPARKPKNSVLPTSIVDSLASQGFRPVI
jgi:hypothetical protein